MFTIDFRNFPLAVYPPLSAAGLVAVRMLLSRCTPWAVGRA